jgi:hypothetical protein
MAEEGGNGVMGDTGGGLNHGIIDELVSLRFKARQTSVQQLSEIKALKKAIKSSGVDVDPATADIYDNIIAVNTKASQDILSVCDKSRDVLKDQFGIQISDTKDRSMWKKTT